MSILDRFPVVLLDMNGTFMFGEDRFGSEHDYAATYRDLGGRSSPARVRSLIRACYESLGAWYPDPAYYDCFPSVRETLRQMQEADGLSEAELDRLEQTFAAHELGHVPTVYAEAVAVLASRHRLGLVADVWSEKKPWLDELRRSRLLDLFDVMVFSSEIGSVKPSPRPFLKAIDMLSVRPEECVFVGDSVRRDIRGAKAAGLSTVWIGEAPHEEADWTIQNLLALC